MTCTSIRQVAAKLYVEPGSSPYTFDSSSERWEFVTETLQEIGTLAESQTTLGTRFKDVAQTRKGTKSVGGDIVFEPSKTWFDLWLPRILGAAESTDTFDVAESLPSFAVLVDRVYTTPTYQTCYVNRFSLRGSVGQIVQGTVNIVGLSRSTASAPSVTLTYSDAGDMPYVFSDTSLSLGAEAMAFSDFELTVENNLIVKFNNSVNATSICPGPSRIMLRAKVDPNSTTPYSTLGVVATTGIAGVLTLTNGIASTTWTFGKLVKPDTEYTINSTTSVDWDVELEAKKNNTTPIVTVENEDTP